MCYTSLRSVKLLVNSCTHKHPYFPECLSVHTYQGPQSQHMHLGAAFPWNLLFSFSTLCLDWGAHHSLIRKLESLQMPSVLSMCSDLILGKVTRQLHPLSNLHLNSSSLPLNPSHNCLAWADHCGPLSHRPSSLTISLCSSFLPELCFNTYLSSPLLPVLW
jgi:hypothetical protein